MEESKPSPKQTSETPVIEAAKSDKKTSKKSNKLAIILIVIVALIAVVALVLFLVFGLGGIAEPISGSRKPFEHHGYFVPESAKEDTKYALVDQAGKELTEYNIEKYSQFIFGSTIVKTADGWGIMNDSGRMVTKPDEYEGLSRVGGLYTAFKPGTPERKLIDSSGHVVTDYSSTLNTDLGQKDYTNKNALIVAIRREDDMYDIYDASGKHIDSIQSKKTPVISATSSSYGIEDAASALSYEGGLIVIRNSDLKLIFKTSEVDKTYRLTAASKDTSQLIFTEVLQKDAGPTLGINHAIYTGSVFKEIGVTCRSIHINDSELVPSGYINCNTKDGAAFYDVKANLHLEFDSLTYTQYYVIDKDHYVRHQFGSSGEATTANGKSLGAPRSVYDVGANFVAMTSDGKTIYDQDGEKICNLPSGITSFRGFDKNNVAIVVKYDSSSSTGGLRLMNQKCETITPAYQTMNSIGNYYLVNNYTSDDDGSIDNYEVGLIDKEGAVRFKLGDYKSFTRVSFRGATSDFIIAKKSDNTGAIYDDKLNKIIDLKESSVVYNENQHIIVTQNDKLINYYTLDGTELRSVQVADGARSHT